MARRKRTKEKRTSDMVKITAMYFQGATQYEIGKDLGLTQQQISYDLKKLRELWLSQAMQNITEGKAKELAEIDHLEKVAWQAWTDSQGEHVITTDKSGEDGDSFTTRKEDLLGDAAFLRQIQWCINKRCEILGLDAVTRNMNVDMSQLNDQQVQRLADGEDLYNVIANPSSS